MNNTQQNKSKKPELGALWKKKSKTGMSFLSGYVKVDDLGLEKEIKVVVFANNNKSNEKAPDYRIYISKPLGSENDLTSGLESNNEVKAPASASKKTKSTVSHIEKSEEDDIL